MPAAGFSGQIKKILTFERTFFLILIIAFILRFAFLDLKLLHHDEAIHAWFSYNLLTTGAWSYDPSYHGPFLYFVTAAMFAVLGASDLVARLLPSFFGLILIPFVYWIYRLGYLDKKQTILAALFIAISPDMVYFSRFLRHDIFMLTFTLLLVVALLAYFEKGQSRYAVLAAIATTGSLACKEEMPVILIIFAVYFIVAIRQKQFALPPQWKTDLLFCALFVVGILALLYSAFGAHVDTLIGKDFMLNTTGWYQAVEHWGAMHNQQRLGGPFYFYIPLYLLYEVPIFILAIIATLQFLFPVERIRVFFRRLLNWIRYRTFTLSTAELAGASIRQLSVPREGTRKTDEFIRFCIWWMFLTMAFYAWVGEKVPWLLIPQLLPMIFVATYRLNLAKIAFAAIGVVFLIGMTWHIAFVPVDISEPIVQVQNSEDMRTVMGLMDRADRVVLASTSYWPLPWYYRGDIWKEKITLYGERKDMDVLTAQNPEMIILHDTESYDMIEGYDKTTYKLCYWFSFYDNEHRLAEYYLLRDGKLGSINLDVFTRNGFDANASRSTAAVT
ncbi:MAG: Dolichyl-phosphate-mannose-protein mannosyltransferase [Methanoregula sp. PtaU1.Bin051]|nr:MAG: Dolichyl-phosphate-mannose-protein mannosyltransferase [Methanoregula sp. PtaU1.Bin051]